MRKRLAFIFSLAIITATGIILFQVYWVYNSYKTAENNFHTTVANALKKSVDIYIYDLQQNQSADSLAHNDGSNLLLTKPQSRPVNQNSLPQVKLVVASLLSQQFSKPINLALLTKTFKQELSKSGINIPFKLVVLKSNWKIDPADIAVLVGFLKDAVVIQASFENQNHLLLTQNIGPAMVSIILILMSAGSLFYMGYIIRRQILLDSLKNDFITNIIHELRTPVSILKSSNEALTNFGASADPARSARYLQINSTILDKLEVNLERMLDITQYEHGTKVARYEQVNLPELVTNVVQMYSLNAGVSITTECHLPHQQVSTDSYLIETILANLLDNAIKYAGERSVILVSLTAVGQGWQLQVTDNGKGIKKGDLAFIFDKFHRVQTGNLHETKGYGLGLSYVKQLVNALNGHISVESKIEKGTTFTIRFPFHRG